MAMRLAGELEATGAFRDPAWRAAYERTPRHWFIPDVVWTEPESVPHYVAVSKEIGSEAWYAMVYSDQYIVTQVDDGAAPAIPGMKGEESSSSASQPSLVFAMLNELDVHDSMTVLEAGTGTGYNAGLLCARLGGERVVTVEIDKGLATEARSRLASLGFHPDIIVGDAGLGYAERAPYDRVIATYAVRTVPYPWIEQTRPGGVLVIPWTSRYFNGALLRLEKGSDADAHGVFVGPAAFMRDRGQRLLSGTLRDHVTKEMEERATKTSTGLDPRLVTDEEDAEFAIGLQVDCERRTFYVGNEFTLWILDGAGSWASVDYEPDAASYTVFQDGPRQLWTEVEAAYQWWTQAGRAIREAFGVTVTAQGQSAWLHDPDEPVPTPAHGG